jgi:hypothetical protein
MVDVSVLELAFAIGEFREDVSFLAWPGVPEVDEVPFVDLVLVRDVLRDVWVAIPILVK